MKAPRLPSHLKSALTAAPLATKILFLLGELSRDSSERFSRRKFFCFAIENILLESMARQGLV
jgi:hypothetical protein